MTNQFYIQKENRKIVATILDKYTDEQLNKIPKGFKNNLIWNIAHLLVTQQLLTYALAGLDCLVSKEMIKKFGKGSFPQTSIKRNEINTIKEQLIPIIEKSEDDYKKGLLSNFKPYTTSLGNTLNTIEDAIQFATFHEGIHLGIILSLKKLV